MAHSIDKKSLQEELASLIAGGRVHAAFFSTFTFGRQFFESRILPGITDEGARLGKIPVSVVVDVSQYRGSSWGYQVVRPPSDKLWHAKLILIMLKDGVTGCAQTILGLGSANLTRTGWEDNSELFSFRSWPQWCVPKALHQQLLGAPWFRTSDFATWCKENSVSPKANSSGIRLLMNLSESPLWDQLSGRHSTGKWDEAHIIAPFTDRTDVSDPEPGGSVRGFFKEVALTASSKESVLHVYLAPSDLDASSESNRVVADRKTFEWLARQPLRLRLHILKPDNRARFHAKLFAFKAHGRWAIVAGSANATAAGMVQENGNVEAVQEWPNIGRSLPPGLIPASRAVALNNLVFVKPIFANTQLWNAVERAVYRPKSRRLRIDWRPGHSLRDTRLLVGGRQVDPGNFTITDDVDPFLQCLPKKREDGHIRPGCVPIEVPISIPEELSGQAILTPEEWLERLGQCECEWQLKLDSGGPSHRSKHKRKSHSDPFDWAERVSRLERSLTSLHEMIQDCTSSKEMLWIKTVALGVWQSHNPSAPDLVGAEIAWRKWVRTGLWQVIGQFDLRRAILKPLSRFYLRWQKKLPKKLKEFPIAPR